MEFRMNIELFYEPVGEESFTVPFTDLQFRQLVDWLRDLDDGCFNEDDFSEALPQLSELIERKAQAYFKECVEPQDGESLEDYSYWIEYPEEVSDWFDMLGVDEDEALEDEDFFEEEENFEDDEEDFYEEEENFDEED